MARLAPDHKMSVAVLPNGNHTRHIVPREMTWGEFIEWLDLDDPSDTKDDTKGYVLGTFKKTKKVHKEGEPECLNYHRTNTAVVSRCGLVLDVDHPRDDFFVRAQAALKETEVVWHTTYSSRAAAPRYRMIMPLDREVTPEEYEHIARAVIQTVDPLWEIDVEFDPGSDQPVRFMYTPSAEVAEEHRSGHWKGEPLEVGDWLGVEVEARENVSSGGEKRDPYDLPGEIGEFNRAYEDDWPRLVEEYGLPYEQVEDDRWTLVGSSSEPGAGPVPGTSGLWYSFHSNDPACDQTLSAFDLVRVHKYGDLDQNVSALDFSNLPSMVMMRKEVQRKFGPQFDVITDDDEAPQVKDQDAGVKDRHMPVPTNPVDNARALMRRWKPLVNWRDGWYAYSGGVYQEHAEAEMTARLWKFFADATTDGRKGRIPWNPQPGTISGVKQALQGLTTVPNRLEQGTWVNDGQWQHLVNMRNGLLDPAVGVLIPHSPAYFSAVQLPFEFDPRARCDGWLVFLEDVLSGDVDSVGLLQEWFGYILTGRLDLQKFLYLFGPKRSGKGTVLHIMREVVGNDNVVAPTLSSYAQPFGMQAMIDKPLAITADARSSKSLDVQMLTERLLTISAGDMVSVQRKNRTDWNGILPTRIVIASNDTPWFKDASGAIISRMSMLSFKNSYIGREDIHLLGKLRKELPGILNWALEGVDRLDALGRFTQPDGSVEALSELMDEAAPLQAFAREHCKVGGEEQVDTKVLHDAYNMWLLEKGENSVSPSVFGKMMRSAFPKIEKRKLWNGGERERVYAGISLVEEPGLP